MKDYYKEKRVSNTSLSWFQQSPKYFKLMLDGLIEEPSKPYFETGEQIHMYILEPEEFDKEYMVFDYKSPTGAQQKSFCEKFAHLKKGKKEEKLLKAYKEVYISKESDEKLLEKAVKLAENFEDYIKYIKLKPMYTKILSCTKLGQLNEIKAKIVEHKVASELLYLTDDNPFVDEDKFFAKNEFQINWEHPDGIPCKSLLDRLVIDHENKMVQLIDLKTTSHLSDFKTSFNDFKYYRQLAFYWMAVKWYFKETLKLNINEYELHTFIVAASTSKVTEVKVFKIMPSHLDNGLSEIENTMAILSWHWENDLWDYPMTYYEGEGIELI